ncbi:MAG: acyl-CoA thioesterase [Christensenellales bacterium]
MQVCEFTVKIRYSETGMFSMLRHTAIMDWFDVAICALMAESGTNYGEIERRGLFFPVLETHCRFLASAKLDDTIRARVSVIECGAVKTALKYEFFRQKDNVKIAEGESTHAFVDDRMHLVNIKKVWPELVESLKRYTIEK